MSCELDVNFRVPLKCNDEPLTYPDKVFNRGESKASQKAALFSYLYYFFFDALISGSLSDRFYTPNRRQPEAHLAAMQGSRALLYSNRINTKGTNLTGREQKRARP